MIVTRFAPSPTGELHVGGARTALFAYLQARASGGRFLLRIEDTDRERSVPAHVDRILDALDWLGLARDGETVFQSKRHEAGVYAKLFAALEEKNLAYPCFCSQETLASARAAVEAKGGGFRYPGTCRALSPADRAARRAAGAREVLRLALPREGEIRVADLLRDEAVVFPRDAFDDLVIRKADGWPLFHFAVAVDDALMGVTHVIRGDDHLTNTPKQIAVLDALREATGDARFAVPAYAHLPLLNGKDGKRFSKRHGATSVQAFREMGILPEALFNFLALLGWSPGNDREVMTREEITKAFSLDRCLRRAAVFDEEKLAWMNGQYLSALPAGEILARVEASLGRGLVPSGEDLAAWGVTTRGVTGITPREWAEAVSDGLKVRIRLLPEFWGMGRFFWEEVEIDPAAAKKHLDVPGATTRLKIAREAMASCDWNPGAIEASIRCAAEKAGVGAGKVMHPARVAVTGSSVSPGFFETMTWVGRTRVLSRIDVEICKRPEYT